MTSRQAEISIREDLAHPSFHWNHHFPAWLSHPKVFGMSIMSIPSCRFIRWRLDRALLSITTEKPPRVQIHILVPGILERFGWSMHPTHLRPSTYSMSGSAHGRKTIGFGIRTSKRDERI
jgi:hypothetical protein